jgi:hypothetical protein
MFSLRQMYIIARVNQSPEFFMWPAQYLPTVLPVQDESSRLSYLASLGDGDMFCMKVSSLGNVVFAYGCRSSLDWIQNDQLTCLEAYLLKKDRDMFSVMFILTWSVGDAVILMDVGEHIVN